MTRIFRFRCHLALALAVLAVLGGCASEPAPGTAPAPRPEEVRAQIVSLLPPTLADRPGWAVDLYAALATLGIEPRPERICAVLAITEQESSYRADPTVPRLGQLAREEIDRRAERAGVGRSASNGGTDTGCDRAMSRRIRSSSPARSPCARPTRAPGASGSKRRRPRRS